MPKGENNRKYTPDEWSVIVTEYTTPLPDGTWEGASSIAARYGFSTNALYYHLARAGIPTRDATESHAHGKRCKPRTRFPEGTPPLCACGCGRTTLWNPGKHRWNVFVVGHYRRATWDADWLRREYDSPRSMQSIADELGVNVTTVHGWMKKFGIPRRRQSESLRLSGLVSGKLNGSWVGGSTPERQRLYRSGKWKDVVKAAFERDEFRCQRCGAPKAGRGSLHTHHIRPFATDIEGRFDVNNLVTLCRSCHAAEHRSH